MSFKKLFTDKQWNELQLAVGHVFLMVANADGKIDKKEISAMDNIVHAAGKYGMPFLDEIVCAIKDSGRNILFDAQEDDQTSHETLRNISTIAKVAGLDESNQYKKFLITCGIYVGMASGKFLHAKVSQEEHEKLSEIGDLLHFDYEIVIGMGTADKIISTFK